MIITESNKYNKAYKKVLKNKTREIETLENIKSLILMSDNLHELITNSLKNVYHIEQKKGNLKQYYTARINKKIRLLMKPCGDYPYNTIEITDIEFVDIDDKHYGEG